MVEGDGEWVVGMEFAAWVWAVDHSVGRDFRDGLGPVGAGELECGARAGWAFPAPAKVCEWGEEVGEMRREPAGRPDHGKQLWADRPAVRLRSLIRPSGS